jgi:putative ABC transport system permease protein
LSGWQHLKVSIQSLRAHSLRTALAVLGIVVGIAAVIVMIAVAEGARASMAQRIESLGTNLLLVIPGAQRDQGVRLAAGSSLTLTRADATAIAAEIPSVILAAPFVADQKQMAFADKNWSALVAGVTPDYLIAREWRIADGQAFTDEQFALATPVVLVGGTVAKELFAGRDPIGQTIRIDRSLFVVIGRLAEKGQDLSGRDQDDVILMPLTTAKIGAIGRSLVAPDAVHSIVVKVFAREAMLRVADEIRALLRRRHKIAPGKDDDFRIQNLVQVTQARDEAYWQFSLFVAILASVSLVVGGIGVMNIMLVSVAERRREIAIRTAVGARQRDIHNQFLIEALVLCLFGGVFGLMFGIAISYLITSLVGWQTTLDPLIAFLAIGCSAAVGITFGLYPAVRASRLDPMAALRAE